MITSSKKPVVDHELDTKGLSFDPKSTAVIIVGSQEWNPKLDEDFVDIWNDVEAETVLAAIKNFVEESRRFCLPIIHVRPSLNRFISRLCLEDDYPERLAHKRKRGFSESYGDDDAQTGFTRDEHEDLYRYKRYRKLAGGKLPQLLEPIRGEAVVNIPSREIFEGNALHRVLLARGVRNVFIVGGFREPWATWSVRTFKDWNYSCCVLTDCVGGLKPDGIEFLTRELLGVRSGKARAYLAESKDLKKSMKEYSSLRTPDPIRRSVTESQSAEMRVSEILSFKRSLPPIQELLQKYRDKVETPESVIRSVFNRIRKYEKINPGLWEFLRHEQTCIQEAQTLSKTYAKKELPLLFGVPFAIKANMNMQYEITSPGFPEYGYRAERNALAVTYLIDHGAILIGKTIMDQFATGLTGCRSPRVVPHCVSSKAHITGGSSSGSAVVVGAGLVSFALGTDTAGSGRVPAAFNGTVGFKPTKGTISARGIVPACKSLDTVSIMAPSVIDARQVWYIINEHDALDPYAKLPASLPIWESGKGRLRMRFAIPPEHILRQCSLEYRTAFARTVEWVKSYGAQLIDIDYTPFEQANGLIYGASLSHERLAGIGPDFLKLNMYKLHPEIQTVFRDMMSSELEPWHVFRDQELQRKYTREAEKIFEDIDVLLVPTAPSHPTIKEVSSDPHDLNTHLGLFSHAGNVLDLCGVSVNAGWVVDDGSRLPFGVTFLGPSGFDGMVLDVATVFESHILEKRSR